MMGFNPAAFARSSGAFGAAASSAQSAAAGQAAATKSAATALARDNGMISDSVARTNQRHAAMRAVGAIAANKRLQRREGIQSVAKAKKK